MKFSMRTDGEQPLRERFHSHIIGYALLLWGGNMFLMEWGNQLVLRYFCGTSGGITDHGAIYCLHDHDSNQFHKANILQMSITSNSDETKSLISHKTLSQPEITEISVLKSNLKCCQLTIDLGNPFLSFSSSIPSSGLCLLHFCGLCVMFVHIKHLLIQW